MMFKLLGFAAMAVSASASSWACGREGEECCNKSDCIGNGLVCEDAGTHDSVCVERTTSHCGECCGEDDCPYGKWCTDDNKCEAMCGTEGAECCNGTDCTGNELSCEHPDTSDSVCVKGTPCGEEGAECCNGKDCNGNELVCDKDEDTCVDCGGDWQPPCPGNVCRDFFAPASKDGSIKCMVCGKEGSAPCPYGKCRDDLVSIHVDGEDLCLPCGAKGEVPCPNKGCDDDLVEIDDVCSKADCGEIGELPCDDGCADGKMPAEAAGGVCVRSCGDPFWVCCDGPSRCKRDTLTCVEKNGTDKDGIDFEEACVECGGEHEPVCDEPGAKRECDKGLWAMNGICMLD